MMGKPPIEELDFVCGVNVIQIEDLRVARGLTRRPKSACNHTSLVYDPKERRIWCKNCEEEIEGFDAFVLIAERAHAYDSRLKSREKTVKEAEAFTIRSRAAKVMDQAWRSRSMIPNCPHCHRGIFPDDVVNGVSMTGKEFAERQAKKIKGGE